MTNREFDKGTVDSIDMYIHIHYTIYVCGLCIESATLLERYKAITKPLEYGVKRTPRRMIGWVALVWCMAGCISLVPLLILGNEHTSTKTGESLCSVCENRWYQFYATMCSFYIPTAVMIYVSEIMFTFQNVIPLRRYMDLFTMDVFIMNVFILSCLN